MFDAIKYAIGAGAGFGAAIVWATLIYGPAQYDAGGLATAAKLEAATNTAIKELSNEADGAAFARRLCHERGGVFRFVSGQCEQIEAE